MNLLATQDNLVLRPIMASGISAGGVVLPGAKQFEDGCIVLSIGPHVEDIAVGDVVVRPDPPRYTIVDDDTNEVLFICAEVDILAKILPENHNAADQAEKAENPKEMDSEKEGQDDLDGVPQDSVASVLPIRPLEGLS